MSYQPKTEQQILEENQLRRQQLGTVNQGEGDQPPMAEDALQQSLDDLQAIYESILDGVIVLDAEMVVPVRANPAFCEMLGYSQTEAYALLPEHLHPREVLPAVWGLFAGAQSGEPSRIEGLPFLRKDGGVIYADTACRPLQCNRRPSWVVFVHDVTGYRHDQEAWKLREQSLLRILEDRDNERQLMAYEIHDGLAQYLDAACLYCQAGQHLRQQDRQRSDATYDQVLHLLDQSRSEARRLMAHESPPVLAQGGLRSAIIRLAEDDRVLKGLQIELDAPEEFGRLPAFVEQSLYRIVQEALTNVHRHSGSNKAAIKLLRQRHTVLLEVRDWGTGFDPASIEDGHVGLKGMHERVRILGGQFSISGGPGKGTIVRVEVPAASNSADHSHDP